MFSIEITDDKHQIIIKPINFSFFSEFISRICAIPGSRIVISASRNHNRRHDRFNVESRPHEHNFVQQLLLRDVISLFLESFFTWSPSLIDSWIRVVSIVVRLNQEPSALGEFIWCMYWVDLSFDDDSFIGFSAWNYVIDRTADPRRFQSFDGIVECSFLSQYSLHQPTCRDGAINENADQILVKVLGRSCIHIDGESTRLGPSQRNHTADDQVRSIKFPTSLVVFSVNE